MLSLVVLIVVTKTMLKLLIVAQILDALFTLTGIHCLGMGLAIEGNPLMRYMMATFGAIPAMVVVKGVAIFFLRSMLALDKYAIGVKLIVTSLAALYTFVVMTWVYVLISHLWNFQCI